MSGVMELNDKLSPWAELLTIIEEEILYCTHFFKIRYYVF